MPYKFKRLDLFFHYCYNHLVVGGLYLGVTFSVNFAGYILAEIIGDAQYNTKPYILRRKQEYEEEFL